MNPILLEMVPFHHLLLVPNQQEMALIGGQYLLLLPNQEKSLERANRRRM
jgi:hypothetical protein